LRLIGAEKSVIMARTGATRKETRQRVFSAARRALRVLGAKDPHALALDMMSASKRMDGALTRVSAALQGAAYRHTEVYCPCCGAETHWRLRDARADKDDLLFALESATNWL